jgi:antitoxin (DNA-binding transcriptional repressor) of toxin-antitoxin stability system
MTALLPVDLEDRLEGLKRNGADWAALCPLHPDRNPSLAIKILSDGKVLAHCHAGCDQREVARALGLEGAASRAEWTPHGDAVAVYDYHDEAGTLLFQVLRTAGKQFPQRRPDPTAKTGWRWQLGDVRRVPFRLPQLLDAVKAGQTVYVTEGEKDALALVARGKIATCNPGGAGKWRPEFAAYLADATVIVVADKDKPGQAHARQVAASLHAVNATVWVVEAADPHKDVSDHLAGGLDLAQLVTTHRPDQPAHLDLAPDVHTFLASSDDEYDWLVPGFLERAEQVLLTGFEGWGKSMMLRQIAVCLAAGLHPFMLAGSGADPCRVLIIDCENSERLNRRKFRPMVQQAARDGFPVPAGNLRIIHKTEGVDLTHDDDATWLVERVTAHQPDVLIIGPLYQLHAQNMNDELAARKLTKTLNWVRKISGCAMIIEAHAGHGETGHTRSVRPTGSSLFMRWPEYGYGLKPFDGTNETLRSPLRVKSWRGPRDERSWPEYVDRVPGTGWAWQEWVPQ